MKIKTLYHIVHMFRMSHFYSQYFWNHIWKFTFNKRSIFIPNIFGIIWGSFAFNKLKFLVLDAFGADKRTDELYLGFISYAIIAWQIPMYVKA